MLVPYWSILIPLTLVSAWLATFSANHARQNRPWEIHLMELIAALANLVPFGSDTFIRQCWQSQKAPAARLKSDLDGFTGQATNRTT